MRNFFKISALSRRRHELQEGARRGRWLRRGAVLTGLFILALLLRTYIVLIILQVSAFILTPVLPDIDNPEALYANQSTIIYDKKQQPLYTIFQNDENRFDVPIEKIPETVILATIAAEDDRFFKHPGFDVDGIIKAVLSEFGIGRPRGGSTITQQFIKNAYLSPERTYWRKMQELLLSIKLENHFTKREIIQMYLNRIPYGSNSYGIQAAAQTFLGKNVEDLTLAEAAVLAGIPQAPSRYNPYSRKENLMGYCGKSSEGIPTIDASPLPLKLESTGSVWLKVTTDGKVAKEWTAKTGEIIEFPFAEDFNIISGNQQFKLSVGETSISTGNKSNFSFERKNLPASASTVAPVAKVACSSPDDPEYNWGKKDIVLHRMRELGFISEAEYLQAWTESNQLEFTPYREPIRAPHFVFYVRELLEDQYGKDVVERGGLRVFTTLDPDVQAKGEEMIKNAFPHELGADGKTMIWHPNRADASNASFLAVENQTGKILAMVGSRDYFEVRGEDGKGSDGATNLTIRPRQPGSSFKPFVYTTGFKNGYAPASVLWDVETLFGGEYKPKNFDGSFMGPMSIRRALGHSRNIPAVKMAVLAGEKAIVETVHSFGLKSVYADERYGPAIGLGAAEIPMIEMVQGYSVFANGGKLIPFTPIEKITDAQGRLIEEFEQANGKQVLEPELAYLMTSILSDSSARPAGWNSFLNIPGRINAAKTGTANKRISETEIFPGDIWTMGFTPQITAGAWMGNNDGRPMNMSGEGLTSVGPIWRDIMTFAHKDLPVLDFAQPENIVERSVSRLTGLLASSATPTDQIIVDKFASWGVPLGTDTAFEEIEVDAASGKLPGPNTPESAKIKKKFINIHSERPDDPAWETPVQNWVKANFGTDTNFELPPTEVDDLHTAQTALSKPSLNIVAPVSGSTIQRRSVGVWVDVVASHGVEKVEYYRDGELLNTSTSAPWKGTIPIPLNAKDGDRFTITAKVFDKLYYTDTSSVEVTIGDDTQMPTVRIISPKAAQQVARNTTLLVQVEAFDAGGDIEELTFKLDGNALQKITKPPYEYPLFIRSDFSLGSHVLEVVAVDQAGYKSIEKISFEVTSNSEQVADFSIVSPSDGFVVAAGTTKLEVVVQIDRSKFVAEEVDFIARNQTTGNRNTFATINKPTSDTFSVTWTDFAPGKYELYFKARSAEGQNVTSGRVQVEVQ